MVEYSFPAIEYSFNGAYPLFAAEYFLSWGRIFLFCGGIFSFLWRKISFLRWVSIVYKKRLKAKLAFSQTIFIMKILFTYYRIRKENLLKFFRAIPVPLATARNGSSAIWTFSLVLLEIRWSRPRNNEPPPAR